MNGPGGWRSVNLSHLFKRHHQPPPHPENSATLNEKGEVKLGQPSYPIQTFFSDTTQASPDE